MMLNLEPIFAYVDQYLKDFKPYKNGNWCYEDGVVLAGLIHLYEVTKRSEYLDFIMRYFDQVIEENGNMTGYYIFDYNIDNILPGVVLQKIEHVKPKFQKAIKNLELQLQYQPRTSSRSFWHKLKYPYQIWLDGIYMGQIFLANSTLPNAKNDVINQLMNVKRFLYHDQKKLFMHGYDESRLMPWADPITGQSPNAWLRSIGWFAMALVDIGEVIRNPLINELLDMIFEGMLPYLQEEGLWYQLPEFPQLLGNYQETSGSAMLIYALLKAERLNLLSEKYTGLGKKLFSLLIKEKLVDQHFIDTCHVAGLNHTGHDGSIEYYLSEPIVSDEAKAVGPLLLGFAEYLMTC